MVEEMVGLLRSAWAIVQESGVPEHVQPAALSEAVRILAADRRAHPAGKPITPLGPDH
jgi:hypothetical protein